MRCKAVDGLRALSCGVQAKRGEWRCSTRRGLTNLETPEDKWTREIEMAEVPDFSDVSEQYAASRPLYSPELFEWLAACVSHRETAWDTATGSGQA